MIEGEREGRSAEEEKSLIYLVVAPEAESPINPQIHCLWAIR